MALQSSPGWPGAFPRFLRKLGRNSKEPYRTALLMAAEEIEELRQIAECTEDSFSNALCSGANNDKFIRTKHPKA